MIYACFAVILILLAADLYAIYLLLQNNHNNKVSEKAEASEQPDPGVVEDQPPAVYKCIGRSDDEEADLVRRLSEQGRGFPYIE
jgi:hypothetical protein